MHSFLANLNDHVVSTDYRVWIGAICTLAVFSFLYRENRFYRFFEHVMLGVGVGFAVMATWTDLLETMWWRPMVIGFHNLLTGHITQGWPALLWVSAAVFGSFWYLQTSKKLMWLSRVTIGIMIGAGAGATFKGCYLGMMPQIQYSFLPFIMRKHGSGAIGEASPIMPWASVNNIIFVVTLVCVLMYFLFSFEHRGRAIRGSVRIGRIMLMVSFGAFFANAVMTRLAVLLFRFEFLMFEWLRLPRPT